MEFGLTHEQQLVVDTVRDFVEKEFYPLEDEVERTGQVPGALGREIRTRSSNSVSTHRTSRNNSVGAASIP